MGKGLNEFIIEGFGGVPRLDIEKAKKIPLEEFRRRYIEEMQTYFDYGNTSVLKCYECGEEIKSAEELFRYSGLSLHKECLRKRYEADKKKEASLTSWTREYFDLILEAAD